jgi:hypothetical protein
LEGVQDFSQADVRGAILRLPQLKKLLVRFGENDTFPWSIAELRAACPLMKVYSQRIADLASVIGQSTWNPEICKGSNPVEVPNRAEILAY